MAVYFRILKILIILCFWSFHCSAQLNVRDSVESVLKNLEGVTERTGHNDGPEIKAVLATCGLKEGNPYCAATVNYAFGQAGIFTGVVNPAYSPNWFTQKEKVVYKKTWKRMDYKSKKCQVFGLYFPDKGRVAHVGFIISEFPTWYKTFEGNTSGLGAVESDGSLTEDDREAGVNGGFFYKKRPKSQIYIIADYLEDYENGKKDWRGKS